MRLIDRVLTGLGDNFSLNLSLHRGIVIQRRTSRNVALSVVDVASGAKSFQRVTTTAVEAKGRYISSPAPRLEYISVPRARRFDATEVVCGLINAYDGEGCEHSNVQGMPCVKCRYKVVLE